MMEILMAKKKMENEEGLNHIMIKIQPPKDSEKITKPIAFVVVLDKSGSMQDDVGESHSKSTNERSTKMDYAKRATIRLIDMMNDGDKIAVVSFSDTVNLEYPLTELNIKEKFNIKDRVNLIEAEGSTNISGGLEMAYNLIPSHLKESHHIKLILMSDGEANFGIRDADGIATFVRKFQDNGVSVSTIGIGNKYNSYFMEMIATASGGMFYHLKEMNLLDEIFVKELRTLTKLKMKNAKLTIKAEKGIVLEENLNGYEERNKGLIYLGNIFNELKVVYQISTIEKVNTLTKKINVILEYENENNEKYIMEKEEVIFLVDEDNLEVNKEVTEYVKTLMEAKTKRDALRHYEDFNSNLTQHSIQKGINVLNKMEKSYNMDTSVLMNDMQLFNDKLSTRALDIDDVKEMYASNYNVLRNSHKNE